MFTKFRNRLPDIDVFIVGVMFILLLPLILIFVVFIKLFPSKVDKQFQVDYAEFLKKHDGYVFFCYTNRKVSVDAIEKNVLPNLDKAVHVIKLVNKSPQSKFDERFISNALNNLKNVGFPNVMKIVNNEIIDYSLHNQVYDAVNQKNELTLAQIIADGLRKLNRT